MVADLDWVVELMEVTRIWILLSNSLRIRKPDADKTRIAAGKDVFLFQG